MANGGTGGILELGQILANALALPNTIMQQQQAAQSQRALLSALGSGFTPQQINAFYPLPPLGQQGSISGGLFGNPVAQTIGSVGQLLQGVLGAPPSAPRPPLSDAVQLASLGQFQRKRELGQEVKKRLEAGEDPRKIAPILAETQPATALRIMGSGPTSAFRLWQQQHPTGTWEEYQQAQVGFRKETAADPYGMQGVPTEFKLWLRDNPTGTWEQFQHEKSVAAGEKARLTNEEREKVKQTVLTNATRTMVESAPKVIRFVDTVERDLKQIETGPFASRYQEFMAGRIGAPNPEFTRYRTNVGLLTTLLMRMHVGARGGQLMLAHFTDLFNAGVQSPENMRAALEAVREYATDLQTHVSPPPAPSSGGGEPTTTPGGTPYKVLP